jgi:predicted porin
MNKKVLAAAVATSFAPDAAIADPVVHIGGTINIVWDYVKASGATRGPGGVDANLKAHDRVRDGGASNIRFTVIEDLGEGVTAFVQVESAVIANSDTRTNAAGQGGVISGWGNRNSAIGIRSLEAGRFLIGVWDLHYDDMYKVDQGWLFMNTASSTLGLMNNFGLLPSQGGVTGNIGIGARYNNTIRWDSPIWDGFSMTAGYARPTDNPPVNSPGDPRNGKKNRAYSVSPRYEIGSFLVAYSYLQDKDIGVSGTISYVGANLAAGTGNLKVTSNRLGVRYRFDMGLGIGMIYDDSKLTAAAIAGTADIKRKVWSVPVTFSTGGHLLNFQYSWAGDWKGSVSNNVATINGDPGIALNRETGAWMYAVGYSYRLSKRTNVHVTYQEMRNEKAVRYDFFANSSNNGGFGADPKQLAFGLRHTW